MATLDEDTIAAIATAPGKGGVGIVRISGKNARLIAEKITAAAGLQKEITPRRAIFSSFYGANANLIDRGVLLYFSAPNSFTGEDVIEFQCHGSPVVLDCLLKAALQHGARMARAGEFSERAFLNNKLDLTQVEAIADLINSATEAAAQSAIHSLQGDFSKEINKLVDGLIALRAYIEAAIDFPEEEVNFLADKAVSVRLEQLRQSLVAISRTAQQGVLLTEGATVVITGKPNAGKSSLLNVLAAHDAAIVTPIAGTTRDILREHIQLDGIPLQLVDTAGLHSSLDLIEREGIRRAQMEITRANHVLLIVDSNELEKRMLAECSVDSLWPACAIKPPADTPATLVLNKCDLSGLPAGIQRHAVFAISTKTGAGINELKEHLKSSLGYRAENTGRFSARRRHLEALQQASHHIERGYQQLYTNRAGELLAEDLRLAQQSLEVITGRFTPDDLLEKIFRDFCIGK